MKKWEIVSILLALAVTFAMPLSAKTLELTGAGASFPYPLYSKMFTNYNRETGVKVNYQSIGSGGGIRQIKAKTVDFGASDAYLNDKQLGEFSDEVVHIPTTAGAVVVAYNIPGNPEIKFTGDIVSDIFLGKITKWNDDAIKSINKGIKLPDMKIITAHRSDGSGTTFIFSDYLSKVSSEWREKVGAGKALKWPSGLGGKGNAGVAGLIKQIPGAVGYIELAYAEQNSIPFSKIKNAAGNYITPSLKSVSLAADTKLPADMRVTLTNSPAEEGYPISGFTWVLSYKDLSEVDVSKEKAEALVKLFSWMITDGQTACEPLGYAPLSKKAQDNAKKIISSINYKGQKL